MSKSPGTPSYEDLAALVVEQVAVIEALQIEVAALRRQVGRDSSTSSQPPSQDGPAAKAKAKADKRAAEQTDEQESQDAQQPEGEREPAAERVGPKRAQGGQRGHRGSGLQRVAVPNRSEPVEPPACGDAAGS